jgi:hypothetical protein
MNSSAMFSFPTQQEKSMTVQQQIQSAATEPSDEDTVPTAQEKAQEKDKENEQEADEIRVLEQGDPPANLDDWHDGPAKYLTYGSSEDEPYGTGVTAKLGPANLERHRDGSIVIDGHKVDNPEDYKAKPLDDSRSHPDATNS